MTRSTFGRFLRTLASTVICLLALAVVAGAIYQFISGRLDEGKYPPGGDLVDIGGRKLHLNCTGTGSPTVILESGLGGMSLDWSLVQPEVAATTRVCSYDRAGIAWSDIASDRRTAADIDTDLHRLLSAASIPPPYLLVGHSIGGIYVQLFAAKYPDEVAGVVLVDSSHPDQLSRYPGIPRFIPYLYKALGPLSVGRLINNSGDAPPNLPAALDAERRALLSETKTIYSIADEMSGIPASMAELRDAPMQLDTKPLIVIARGLNEGSAEETEAIWREMQTDLTKGSTHSKFVIAANSGHYVQFFEPHLVADSIRQIVEQTR